MLITAARHLQMISDYINMNMFTANTFSYPFSLSPIFLTSLNLLLSLPCDRFYRILYVWGLFKWNLFADCSGWKEQRSLTAVSVGVKTLTVPLCPNTPILLDNSQLTASVSCKHPCDHQHYENVSREQPAYFLSSPSELQFQCTITS
jgi:hypothetical protein